MGQPQIVARYSLPSYPIPTKPPRGFIAPLSLFLSDGLFLLKLRPLLLHLLLLRIHQQLQMARSLRQTPFGLVYQSG